MATRSTFLGRALLSLLVAAWCNTAPAAGVCGDDYVDGLINDPLYGYDDYGGVTLNKTLELLNGIED